ncbi:MAG: hypothetical protein OEX00_00365 [Gammaproteobacteria bacterium]|nr:hypothetical protein [Gammaproteobacteria bacterium]MDH5693409.1 hypothetical protein [Gammaproteobacteria bacterium]
MRYRLLFALSFLILSTFSFADETQSEMPENSIGLSLGWVEATGLSYRSYFGKNFVNLTFAAAIDKDTGSEYVDFSLGFSRYLTVIDSREFTPMGLRWVIGVETERNTDGVSNLVDTGVSRSPNAIHTGAGFGIDLGSPMRKGFLFSFSLIYTATFRDFDKQEFVRLGLLPSASIHYNF